MPTPLVSPEHIDALAGVYNDFDKAFNRTKSRAAIDGGLMLLAMVDRLDRLLAAFERQATKESAKKGRG